jgi:hypothetical protein
MLIALPRQIQPQYFISGNVNLPHPKNITHHSGHLCYLFNKFSDRFSSLPNHLTYKVCYLRLPEQSHRLNFNSLGLPHFISFYPQAH